MPGETAYATAFLDELRPDPGTASPLYLQLAERVVAAIVRGRLRRGEALPPERLLSEHLAVSRTTVRRAVDELVVRGLVDSRRGSGNFVSPRIEQYLMRLTSFTEDMAALGRTPGFARVTSGVGEPAAEEAAALGLSAGERVSRLVRLRLADGEPLAIERAAVAAADLPKPDLVEGSLYAALRERGLEPVRAVQHLRAATVDLDDAAVLGVALGSPVMAIVRYGYLADGRPVEFTRSTYRADRYDFVAEMRRG